MAIVFDTYAWIEFFKGTEKGKIVRNYLEKEEVLTPSIVLLELSYKADKENWNFKDIFNFIKTNSRIVGIDIEFILSFGSFYNIIKKKIKKIGITDIIIMHSGNATNARILTGDEHIIKSGNAITL